MHLYLKLCCNLLVQKLLQRFCLSNIQFFCLKSIAFMPNTGCTFIDLTSSLKVSSLLQVT